MLGLGKFLKDKRDTITRKIRINVVREEVGYSEYTRWMETKSFDEEEVVDFDELMLAIEEFEKSFKKT